MCDTDDGCRLIWRPERSKKKKRMKKKKPRDTFLFMVTVQVAGHRPNRWNSRSRFYAANNRRSATSRLKNISNVYSTEVTLGRFRNDTTAAEDLQQVVFKFPEFNKLLLRGCLFSYENSDIESDSRGRFSLPIIMFIWSNV